MNEDKQYIKPYKLNFLQAYIDYMYLTREKNEEYAFERFYNLCCAVQIGSMSNKYRVDLIKYFEARLLIKAVNRLHSIIWLTNDQYNDIHRLFCAKLREDLFYDILV